MVISSFLKAMPLLSRCRDGTHSEEDMSWISGSDWILLFHRTSRLGPAAKPAAEAVHPESRAGVAFPPRQTKADTVSASCSGARNFTCRYLFNREFYVDVAERHSSRKHVQRARISSY